MVAPVCGSCVWLLSHWNLARQDGEVATRVGVALTEAGSAGSQCWHVCPWLPLQVAQETTTGRAESAPSFCIHPQPLSNSIPFSLPCGWSQSKQLGVGGVTDNRASCAAPHPNRIHSAHWQLATHLCPRLVLLSTLPQGPEVYFWQDPSSWVNQGARRLETQQAGSCSRPDVLGRLLQHQGASLEPPAVPGTQEAYLPPLTAALQMMGGGRCSGCLRVPVTSRSAPMANSHKGYLSVLPS